MWRKVRHVADVELLLLADDGALSPRRRSRALAHVAGCPRCARRRAELAAAMGAAGRACRERPVATAPLHVARAWLCAAMESRARRRAAPGWSSLAAGAAAVLVVVILSWSAVDWRSSRLSSTSVAAGDAGGAAGLLLPRSDLTPGSVRPVRPADICGSALTGGPVVASQVPRQVFQAYGVDYRRAGDYELDFLITPELGGASEASNLWPQPYRSVVWNAYVKDELERHLRRLVCRGAVDLATAQQELASDWIAAYKRRFDTERPLRDYDRFPLTASDVEALQAEALEQRLLPLWRRS